MRLCFESRKLIGLGNRGSLKKIVSFDTATPWRVQKTVQCDSKSKFQGQLLNPPPRRSLARRACVSLPKRHMDETTTRCCGYEGEGERERAWQRKGERAGFRYAVGEESLPEERRGEQRKEKRSRTEGGDDLTERKRSSKTSTHT